MINVFGVQCVLHLRVTTVLSIPVQPAQVLLLLLQKAIIILVVIASISRSHLH
jgi:hypothetical protein